MTLAGSRLTHSRTRLAYAAKSPWYSATLRSPLRPGLRNWARWRHTSFGFSCRIAHNVRESALAWLQLLIMQLPLRFACVGDPGPVLNFFVPFCSPASMTNQAAILISLTALQKAIAQLLCDFYLSAILRGCTVEIEGTSCAARSPCTLS